MQGRCDTEECGKYSNDEGINRLEIQNSGYSRNWDKTSMDNYVGDLADKYQDNNMLFENTDDNPLQSVTFRTHNRSGDQFKCRTILVACKFAKRDYQFTSSAYELKVGEKVRYCITSSSAGLAVSGAKYSYKPSGVVRLEYNAEDGNVATAVKAGTSTVTATWSADNNFVKYSISAKFTVRNVQPASLSNSSTITINAWDTADAPTLQGLPADYTGSVSWTSSDESVAKLENGKIVFGGTGYGKTATITATLPQTSLYAEKKLSYKVTVNNVMRIASKADWEKFCQQVKSGNVSITGTLTTDITDPVTTRVGTVLNAYKGTFEGNGHSIVLGLSGGDYTAPFFSAIGATIRNLTVTGSISSTGMCAASLLGIAKNEPVTIDHCSGSMTGALSGKCGGLVGKMSSGGNAIFNQLEGNDSLVAFTPYLIMMNESTERIGYSQKTVVQAGNISMTGTLRTVLNSEADSLGAYIMQDDGNWKKVMKEKDATAYIPPFRAYLCSTGMGLAHPAIGSVFSDITTGVGNIILKDNDGTMRIYDLQGIDRGTDLNSLPSGIYIRGGKKIRKR